MAPDNVIGGVHIGTIKHFSGNIYNAPPVADSPPTAREKTVFFLGASPFDISLDRIRADREFRAIQKEARRGALTIANRIAATPQDLRDLLDERPDVLHISCHSDGTELLFEDPDGDPYRLSVSSLVRLLTTYRDDGHLTLDGIVFSVCRGSDFVESFRGLAKAVLAWRGDLDDDCAIAFAGAFYRVLCRERPTTLAEAGRLAASEVSELDNNCPRLAEQLVVLQT